VVEVSAKRECRRNNGGRGSSRGERGGGPCLGKREVKGSVKNLWNLGKEKEKGNRIIVISERGSVGQGDGRKL